MRRPVFSSGIKRTPHWLATHLLDSAIDRTKAFSPADNFFTLSERGERVTGGALWRRAPSSSDALLNMIMCTRNSDSAQRCIPAFHATLFSSLAFNDPSLSASEASLFSGCAVSGVHCIQQLDRYVDQKGTPSNSAYTALLQQMCLVRLMTSGDTASKGSIEALQRRLRAALEGSQSLPKPVLSGLLKLPCPPALLCVLVEHVLRSGQGKVEADVFETVMHALLANDNFFRLETFLSMHEIVVLILNTIQSAAVPFDYITIKWTPLMTKWARVYTKMFKGDLLFASFQRLMAAVPEAEVKIPSSFYVYLLGALLDANVYATAAPSTGWDAVLHVAQQALRLHGRNQRELHALWVVLLKAALTIRPPGHECERLLQAYHLCTAAERPAPINKEAFAQLTRYMCTALTCSSSHTAQHPDRSTVEAAQTLVASYSKFVLDREDLNFLWIVNAIGVIGSELWERFGASAQSIFSGLLETLEKVLAARDVAGFHVDHNPTLAKLMERFGVGERAAFWWTCGCGCESPSSSALCLHCTQHSKATWSCAACGALHHSPCVAQRCHCGEVNPRLRAAMEHQRLLCPSCGGVCDENDLCVACNARSGMETVVCTCTFCKAPLKSNALYCPSCYTPAAGKRLTVWHCASCHGTSLSNFSTCRTCGEKRRTGSLTAPFIPWHCGCGAVCHPCQWTCRACSSSGATAAPRKAYTCTACHRVSGLSLATTLKTSNWDIRVRLCEHCGEVHPHDRETLESPKLPHHCALCGATVPLSNVFLNGGFYHCGANQWVNENMPFQCTKCEHKDERQFGYQCNFCGCPRKEICESATTFVWRCLCETGPDAAPCGKWNYSWNDHCASCGLARVQSEWECRARSSFWECGLCGGENLPTDVGFCRHCGKGIQTLLPCETCGRSHLALACC